MSGNHLRVLLVTIAAVLAICLLGLVETTNTAKATSLPENGKIAFTGTGDRSVTYDIYTVEPDGSNLSQLTHTTDQFEERPVWSPDGTEITFSVAVGGGDAHIPVMSADGSDLRELPTDPNRSGSISTFPSWSPDGTKLAFSIGEPPDHFQDIYTMDLDGSNLSNLTKTPEHFELYADFSPDGSQICFNRGSDGPKPAPGIYIMNADGSDPTLLFEAAEECDWSPGGTKIAFHSSLNSADGDEEVYVINADGTGWTALTSNSAADTNPDWSPDGKKIAFASNRDGDFDIYTMDADGSNVAQVTSNSAPDDTAVADDMDPD